MKNYNRILTMTQNHFTSDTIRELITEARLIQENSRSDFDNGKLFGYYEAISLLLRQAEAFGLLEQLPADIRDFDPDELI